VQNEPGLEAEGNAGAPVGAVVKATPPVWVGLTQAVPLKVVPPDDNKVWDEAEGISDEFDEVDTGLLFAFTSLRSHHTETISYGSLTRSFRRSEPKLTARAIIPGQLSPPRSLQHRKASRG